MTSTGHQDGLGTHLSYGAIALFSFSDRFKAGFSAEFASMSLKYDLIGSAGSVRVKTSTYQALVTLGIGRIFSTIDVSALGSVGLSTLSMEERLISAGGLGLIKVPGRSEKSATFSIGMIGTRELVPRLSIFVIPRVLLVSPAQISSPGYSIGGGLSIGMF